MNSIPNFIYLTKNISTGEQREFYFDSYQGDVGNYIDYHNQLWSIVNWAVEFDMLDAEVF